MALYSPCAFKPPWHELEGNWGQPEPLLLASMYHKERKAHTMWHGRHICDIIKAYLCGYTDYKKGNWNTEEVGQEGPWGKVKNSWPLGFHMFRANFNTFWRSAPVMVLPWVPSFTFCGTDARPLTVITPTRKRLPKWWRISSSYPEFKSRHITSSLLKDQYTCI